MALQPSAATVGTTHPLEQISAAEIQQARQLLAEAGLVAESTRFAYLGLLDPEKAELYAEDPVEIQRRVRVMLYEPSLPRSLDIVLSLTTGEIEFQTEIDPATDGEITLAPLTRDLILPFYRASLIETA